MSLLWALLQEMLLAAVPALGFAMVFNVPLRAALLRVAWGHRARFAHADDARRHEHRVGFAAGGDPDRYHRYLLVALAAGAPEGVHRGGGDPDVPGISAYTAMITVVEISHLGYSEALMETMITNFLKASFIVGALSIGLSLPGLWLYRKRPGV